MRRRSGASRCGDGGWCARRVVHLRHLGVKLRELRVEWRRRRLASSRCFCILHRLDVWVGVVQLCLLVHPESKRTVE